MKKLKLVFPIALGAILGLVWVGYSLKTGRAEQTPEYVGSDVCAMCHSDVVKKWSFATHRRTLFNKEPSRRGCEACHGPGGAHVAGGGDKSKIVRPQLLKPEDASQICLKCHTQEEVTLWPTSQHARSKMSCIKCHDPHSVGQKSMLADIEGGKLQVEGLTRAIKDAELAANTVAPGTSEKEALIKKFEDLKAEKKKIEESLKGQETIYHRTTEPYVCFNCHKRQEVQSKMPSHHPMTEEKVKCSSCHNPHGGPNGMLREETVNETCYKCHAEKEGPFTFEHPPVSEDCSICHTPHGSTQDNLLIQNQPFLCLKCHVGPHSRSSALGSPVSASRYFARCTGCHNQIHGSDDRPSFRF